MTQVQPNKKALSERQCLTFERAGEHALTTAVPYVEVGTRIHGLDVAPAYHLTLRHFKNSNGYRLTQI